MTTLHFVNVEVSPEAFCGRPGGATTFHPQAVTCPECLRMLKTPAIPVHIKGRLNDSAYCGVVNPQRWLGSKGNRQIVTCKECLADWRAQITPGEIPAAPDIVWIRAERNLHDATVHGMNPALDPIHRLNDFNGPKLVEEQERAVWHERLQRGLDAIAYAASACPYCGSVLILRVDLSGWSGWCWPCPCRRDHRVTYQAARGAWAGPQSGVARVPGVGISGAALVIYADDQGEAP